MLYIHKHCHFKITEDPQYLVSTQSIQLILQVSYSNPAFGLNNRSYSKTKTISQCNGQPTNLARNVTWRNTTNACNATRCATNKQRTDNVCFEILPEIVGHADLCLVSVCNCSYGLGFYSDVNLNIILFCNVNVRSI